MTARVICLTRKEGKVKWIHQLPRYEKPENKKDPIIWAGPVLVSDRLVVASSNGYAETLSPYTGELLGRMEIPGGTTIAPVVADGTLYIYTDRRRTGARCGKMHRAHAPKLAIVGRPNVGKSRCSTGWRARSSRSCTTRPA